MRAHKPSMLLMTVLLLLGGWMVYTASVNTAAAHVTVGIEGTASLTAAVSDGVFVLEETGSLPHFTVWGGVAVCE